MNSKNTKFLLVAVNSKYNHVSLSVKCLDAYVKKYSIYQSKTENELNDSFILDTKYFTINQPLLEIISAIECTSPDAIFFSVYIWNVEIVQKIINELKKVLPECVIGTGGPEVSYDAQKVLENKNIDFVMSGEGERTLTQLCDNLYKNNISESKKNLTEILENIKGIYFRKQNQIIFTGNQPLITNLDELPFCYDDGKGNLIADVDPENSIIYYESSRGCPFRCSYCLSSVDKSVRFKSLNKVKEELSFFMKHNVRLVKFVDRTYNLNEERYIAIWSYILNNWNGKTTFHFEIAAQQLTQKALDSIQNVPFGCMQFEIGIQSTNSATLEQVGRPANLEQISNVLALIPKTIHVHLDLIAGLPYESIKEFESSFNYTITQKPQMLQLGFLKILYGTAMEEYALGNKEYKWLSVPPYEVLSSPWVSYEEMRDLKKIDNLVDNFYNSQNFVQTFKYLIKTQKNMFCLFKNIATYFDKNQIFETMHKSDAYYEYLINFVTQEDDFSSSEKLIIFELIKFDFLRRTKPGKYPIWFEHLYNKEEHRHALEKYCNIQSTREVYSDSSYEVFRINPFTYDKYKNGKLCPILFVYNKSHLKGVAIKTSVKYEDCECFITEDSNILPIDTVL